MRLSILFFTCLLSSLAIVGCTKSVIDEPVDNGGKTQHEKMSKPSIAIVSNKETTRGILDTDQKTLGAETEQSLGGMESLSHINLSVDRVNFTSNVISRIDEVALSGGFTAEEKKSIISSENKKLRDQWRSREEEAERALYLAKLALSVKSREAWIACVIPAISDGDSRLVPALKAMYYDGDDLDSKQKKLLIDGIARIGGESEIAFLRNEYSDQLPYSDRWIIAAHLARMGDKTGVPTLIEAYEKRPENDQLVRNGILDMLRKLYGEDYGDEIEDWKRNILK